jgi:[CysO sulfur-carrier protein]-S-L-cysteine hydrolase
LISGHATPRSNGADAVAKTVAKKEKGGWKPNLLSPQRNASSSKGRTELSSPFRLQVPQPVIDDMIRHAHSELPYECCGLLAGTIALGSTPNEIMGRVLRPYVLANAAASPTDYDASPETLIAAFRDMRQAGLELLAIYHSHPTSKPIPSRRDLERNHYGSEVVHLIISLQTEPVIRAWRLEADSFRETPWDIVAE